jgi:hypothetical protein
MGMLDFLFQGQVPPATTTYGNSTTGIPTFMTDYTLGLLNKANAVSTEPFQLYGGPRLAQFTPEQQQAFSQTQSSVGKYTPTFQNALDTTSNAIKDNNASAAANPFIQQSGQSAADVVGGYMNPYMSNVTDQLATLGARNLKEKLMPSINSNFIRAGQYGSSAMQGAVGKGLRDTQEAVLNEQDKALQQGYNNAMTAAQSDLSRYGNLGQLSGNLASQTARDQLQAAGQMGSLANMGQTANFKDLAALEAVGNTQQQQGQKSLDMAYNDFMQQRDYPNQQLSMLNALIRGLPYGTQSNYQNVGPASQYGASPLSQMIGGYSLLNAFSGKAEGGKVDAVADMKAPLAQVTSIDPDLSKVKFAKGGQKKRNNNRRSSRGRGR